MKSEADCFSFDDLLAAENQTTFWDGIRNYEARNFLRDKVKIGDLVLYYHSNATPSGVAGIAEVVKEAYPDFTAFDKNHDHYDPKSKQSAPTWFVVDLKAVEKFKNFIGLPQLREIPELENMWLFKRNRLSVTPVTEEEFNLITALGMGK